MGFYYSFWIFRFENKLNWTKIHTSLVCCVRFSKSILRTVCFVRIYYSVHADRWNSRIRLHLTEYNSNWYVLYDQKCSMATWHSLRSRNTWRVFWELFSSSTLQSILHLKWINCKINSKFVQVFFREYVRRRNYRFYFCSKIRNSCWMTNIALAHISPITAATCYRRRRRRKPTL